MLLSRLNHEYVIFSLCMVLWTDMLTASVQAVISEIGEKVAEKVGGLEGKIEALGERLDGRFALMSTRIDVSHLFVRRYYYSD